MRDAVLGRGLNDIDLATSNEPKTVCKLLNAARITVLPTGIEHGTVTAVIGRDRYEITTLRHDVETFGRHARVAFTEDWIADAERRDFTINALYCDPDGTLHDPTGGVADLASGRIRFVGDAEARIREDYLRILRYFRFLAWYGRTPPEAEAIEACARMASEIANLSGERIAAEMLRLLAAPAPARVIGLMAEHGVLKAVASQLDGIERLRSLCALEDAVSNADPVRRLSALIVGGGEAAGSVGRQLRLSRKRQKRLETNAQGSELVSTAMNRHALRVAHYRLGRETLTDLLLLAFSDRGDFERDVAQIAAQVTFVGAWRSPILPINGRDLQQVLGMVEGTALGRTLAELEGWWIDEDFRPDRATLLARAAAMQKD